MTAHEPAAPPSLRPNPPSTSPPPSSAERGLFLALARVGLIGFGGGSALIPVMHRELVDHPLIDDAAFIRDTVVANITPGALPVKLGGLAALHRGRPRSMAAAGLTVAAPGTVLAVVLLAGVAAAGTTALRLLGFVSVGINAFILALLWHYARGVVVGHRHRAAAATVVVVAFALTGWRAVARLIATLTGRQLALGVPTFTALHVIVATIAVVALAAAVRAVRHRSVAKTLSSQECAPRRMWRPLLHATGVLVAALLGTLAVALAAGGARLLKLTSLVLASAVTSFGGGEAYVAVADGYFVAGGYVDSAAFYQQAVPVANALPGPILVKLAALVGLIASGQGWLGWVAALTCAVAAVCGTLLPAVILAVGCEAAQDSWFISSLSAWVLPVVCGLLATTAVSMFESSAGIAAHAGWSPGLAMLGVLVAVVVLALVQWRTTHRDVGLILAAGLASLAAFAMSGGI